MKRIVLFSSLIAVVFLAGCAQEKKEVIQEQNTDMEKQEKPGGYLPSMVDIKDQAGQRIQDAVDKENAKINQGYIDAELEDAPQTENGSTGAESPATGAVLDTNYGKIKVKFYSGDAPKTVINFVKLAKENFYDGLRFHRVIKGFMVQGGDQNSKDNDWADDGQGGPGYTVPAEIKRKNLRGTIATARLGDAVNPKKDSSGSQFFINAADNAFLDGGYTVFGEVTEGMDVVDKIENAKTNANDHPLEDITIKNIELVK